MTSREELLNLADALEKSDWAGVSIGNKMLLVGAIEALRAVPAQNAWQPIETKPKDHFPVLVWGPFGHRVAFEDVTWTWFEACAEEPMDWKPSHWMPLPTRPDALPQQDRGGK